MELRSEFGSGESYGTVRVKIRQTFVGVKVKGKGLENAIQYIYVRVLPS